MATDPNQPEMQLSDEVEAVGLPVVQARPNQTRGADTVQFAKDFTATMTAVADATGIPRTQLNTLVNTIRVDNPTGQWFFEPNAQQWISPYSLGWVLRVHKTQLAELRAITPTSGTSAPVAGETVNATYENSRFEPRPGISLGTLAASGLGLVTGGDNVDAVVVAATGRLFANARQYIFNGATWDRARSGVAGETNAAKPNTGIAQVQAMMYASAGNVEALSNMAGFNDAHSGNNLLGIAPTAYNGTTWDRVRNKVPATLLASAARTLTQTSADIPTFNLSFLQVIVDITVNAGGLGSITLSINVKDPASGKYVLALASVALVAVGTTRYVVGPTIIAAANLKATDVLTDVIQIVITANNANPVTYSVGYVLGN